MVPARGVGVSADPFARLAELAREEHRLVLDGRFDELAALDARRDALMAALPDQTPPSAVPHLEDAARIQALVTVALRDALAAVRAELVGMERRRDALRGYAAAAR
jgi:hypothetical protein